MKTLIDGLVTGLFLQLALGPVFFYILGITLNSNAVNSLVAIVAVTLADYIFIALSLFSSGKLLQADKRKPLFGLASSLLLMLFGTMFLYNGLMVEPNGSLIDHGEWTPFKSFISCFVLTMSSPLTIVFWGSLFSARAIEKNYSKKQLIQFGAGAGAATFLFLFASMAVLLVFKSAIPDEIVQVSNCAVGLVLIIYGLQRTLKIMGLPVKFKSST